MLTCKKLFPDIPMAHRQHKHDGHCALIHGHNWTVSVLFGCHETDPNGFVIDFGRLGFLKDWIHENFDHACLFNEDDPLKETLVAGSPGAWKPYVLPSCSSEGIAEHLHGIFDALVRKKTEGRAFVLGIEVAEDSKNSSAYFPEQSGGHCGCASGRDIGERQLAETEHSAP